MRVRRRTALITAVTTATLTTLGLSLPAAVAPASAAQTITGIAYAPAQPAGSQGHLLDLYLPTAAAPTPLVIWTSGSAWTSDNGRSGANTIAGTFNARGYAVAGVSVRSSSQAVFPAQVHDVKAAIRFLRANAAQYNLDPQRFAIMGDSSGGWVADMATLTGGVTELEGTVGTTGVSSAVQAGVGFFGPTDFSQMGSGGFIDHNSAGAPEAMLLGCAVPSCPDKVQQANPIRYVDRSDPPMLLMHGTADPLVPPNQSSLLYEAIRNVCGTARFFLVPGAGHGTSDVMSSSRYGQQTVRSTDACQETTTVGSPNPSWTYVADWLDGALGRGGATTTTQPTTSTTSTTTTSTTTTSTTTSSPTTTRPTTTQPTTTMPTTTMPTTTTTRPTTTAGGGGCTASYHVDSAWPGGYVSSVIITAGSSALSGWRVTLALPAGVTLTNAWNGIPSGSSGTVVVVNQSYNGTVPAGQSTSFGFQGTGVPTGTTATCAAG